MVKLNVTRKNLAGIIAGITLAICYGQLLGPLDALRNMLWFMGLVFVIGGVFYKYAAGQPVGKPNPRGRELTHALGNMGIGFGVILLSSAWTGGVADWVRTHEAWWFAWVSLGVRGVTLYWELRTLYLSIRSWMV